MSSLAQPTSQTAGLRPTRCSISSISSITSTRLPAPDAASACGENSQSPGPRRYYQSPLQGRSVAAASTLVTHWPCEDTGRNAKQERRAPGLWIVMKCDDGLVTTKSRGKLEFVGVRQRERFKREAKL